MNGLDARRAVHVGHGGDLVSAIQANRDHHQHEAGRVHVQRPGEFEVVLHPFGQDGGGERAEGLPELDPGVHHVLHVGRPRIGQDAAGAQGPRSPLEAPLHPTDHLSTGQAFGHLRIDRIHVGEFAEGVAFRAQELGDAFVGMLLAPVAVLHPETLAPAQNLVIAPERGSQGASPIAGGGLDVQLLEARLAQDPRVGHRVQGHAAGHAQGLVAGPPMQPGGLSDQDLLGHLLDAGRHVGIVGVQEIGLLARPRGPQQSDKALAERMKGRVVVGEAVHVKAEGAVRTKMDHLVQDQVRKAGLPVGRHAHDLVLALVDLEAQEGREGAVQKPQRVGVMHLLVEEDLPIPGRPPGSGGPLAHPVHGQDGRFVQTGRIEGAGGMGHVVGTEDDAVALAADPLVQEVPGPQLVQEPDQHGLAKSRHRARPGGQGGHEDPVELPEGLLVEDDQVQIGPGDTGPVQAEPNRPGRKLPVVLDPREALLLGGSHELPVHQQGGCGVVIEAGDPENSHQCCCRGSQTGGRRQRPPFEFRISNGSEKTRRTRAKGVSTTQ